MESPMTLMLFFNVNQVINTTERPSVFSNEVTFNSTTVYYDLVEMGNETFGKGPPVPPATFEMVVILSVLFFVVGFVGILGNSLVIFVILIDRKMRNSVTNLFIMNLAIADLLIMLFGVPEIVQFMLNRGWILGTILCKFDRFILVLSLYVSVLSLVSVCIER